jgi:hypothetical protein
MNKINLLVSESDLNSFCSTWFSASIRDHFNLIYHEHNHVHSAADTVCVTNFLNTDATWYRPYLDRGYKLIVDHFWDSNITEVSTVTDRLTIRNKNWLWYNESLWYRHLGYHNYIPNKQYKHAFLMLMHLKRNHRDQILHALKNELDSALYSYVAEGITLDNDLSYAHGDWQRYFNPTWYDTTEFSVVVESMTSSPTWVSEKTFKPIAYQHPFIIWGSAGTLQYLKEQGFETFDHVINESYDNCTVPYKRLHHVVDIIKILTEKFNNGIRSFDDSVTKEKLKHNHQRFFDQTLVQQRINDEIVRELLDFIE